jgi:hypothetical protein
VLEKLEIDAYGESVANVAFIGWGRTTTVEASWIFAAGLADFILPFTAVGFESVGVKWFDIFLFEGFELFGI